MHTIHSFSLVPGYVFLLLFWLTWWFKILLAAVIAIAALIFHYVKMNALKHQHANLNKQLLESNELLLYATRKEQRANEKALVEEKNKTTLLSTINHEIRTPMNAVLGMASLLKETELTTEQNEYASTIISSGETLLKVINEIMMNDILEYSKTDSGKGLEEKDIDLNNCIEEVLDVFAGKAAKKGIDLLYYVSENVPSQVVGDVRRLRQILMNLVENAIRVMTTGEIFIGVQMVDCKEINRIKLEFEVRDTGAGMTAEKAGSLSKSFSMPNASQQNEPATGTGLIICRKLVGLMGGAIRVDSTEKEGTSFKFTIYTKASMQQMRTHIHSEITHLENKKILIVDDNITEVELLKRRFENLKMVTSTATSGKEALEVLTQVSFDLVITDLNMPGMDGIALLKQIRKLYPELPAILLTPIDDERYKQEAEIFSAHLNKPVKTHLLLDAVLAQLRNKDKSETNKPSTVHKLSDNFSKQYPLSILIADDNPVNQVWTSKILSKLGYKSEVANNGREVLEIVSTHHYDLILMDVQMPEMDGLEATRMIRLCLQVQPVVMAMTANVMQGDRQACFQSGMDDYISKPLELNEFVGKLEKWALLIKEKRQFQAQSRA